MRTLAGTKARLVVLVCLFGGVCYYAGLKFGHVENVPVEQRQNKDDRSFVGYRSSPFEQKWLGSVKLWEDKGQGVCSHVMEDWERFSVWLDATRARSNLFQDSVFSFMEWKVGGQLVQEAVEPLVGILRDPRRPCAKMDHENIEGKDYIVPLGISGRKVAVFDFGASVWTTAEQGTKLSSQAWLHDAYAKYGFERFACWEATPKTSSEILHGVPKNVLKVFEYTNRPVTLMQGRDHPWTVVRNHCKHNSSSYIVVKLDIDHPATELPLIDELMQDKSLQRCIGEFFFEHHTTILDMKPWWQNSGPTAVSGKLADTYSIMLKLRKMGMRAHVWP